MAMIRICLYLLALLFIYLARPSAAVAGAPADSLKRYLDAGALALSTASEPDGQKAFAIFRQAVATAAKQNGDARVAGLVTLRMPEKPVSAQHHAIALQLLRKYFLARYGEKLGPDLSELLKFRTEAQPHQENWYLPEFVRQRKWLEQKSAELGLVFKSYDGRVDEITLAAGDSIIAILTHGDVVDVEGQTWSSPPWEGRLVDGKVMGRGAMDDKGPIVPALYAIATLRDCGWPLSSTLKLLVANAEETDWSDVQYYLENAPAPQYTIGMDGTFPVTHGQKAYALITFKSDSSHNKPSSAPWQLLSLSGGSSPGIIPEEGMAILKANGKRQKAKCNLAQHAQKWCEAHPPAKIRVEQMGDSLKLKAFGKGGHAAIPENGHNALGDLTAFLATLDLEMDRWGAFAAFIGQTVGTELYGNSLGIAHTHEAMGQLTVNLGVIRAEDGTPTAYLNPRVPVGITAEEIEVRVKQKVAAFNQRKGAKLTATVRMGQPHFVPATGRLVSTLLKTWEEVTGTVKKPIVTGGGLQSRLFPGGVDFGPALSMDQDRSHTSDEYMTIDELKLIGELTVVALWKLATQEE
jgi:succinyl-diaminopimelate desuccinylase